MASVTFTTSEVGLVRTFVYVITDQQNNSATVTAVQQLVTINQTTGTGLLKDGQALMLTLLQLLQTGLKPRVQGSGASSFFDYR